MAGTPKPFFRRRFLVEPKFQFTLVLYFLLIGVPVAVGNYYLMRQAFQGYIDQVAAGMSGVNPEIVPGMFADLRKTLLSYFVVGSVSGLIAFAVGGILVSHRIAGPLYQLEEAMKEYLETGVVKTVRFRKHDFAERVASLYNQVIAKKNNS